MTAAVDKLADDLFDWNWDDDGSGPVRVSLDQLRALARAAAKTALESFADERDPVGPDDAINRALRVEAATYTTEEPS